MVFEIFKGKQRMFVTEFTECIPEKETLSQMLKSGYTAKLDGENAGMAKIQRVICSKSE
ncbi:MAG: hypothetical protein LUC25_01115 [Ruminococcus sp.]|nr:hypothetical protein [Ruminococcus sp.]